MKVSKVEVVVGQVFNLGNYQSARVETRAEVTVSDGENEKSAFDKAYMEAKAAFAKYAANFLPKKEGG